MTTARIHQAIAATAFFCFAGALRLEALHFLTLLSILAARKILFFLFLFDRRREKNWEKRQTYSGANRQHTRGD